MDSLPTTPSFPAPSETGSNGRDRRTGRFLPGNRAARGNPVAKRAASFRAALFRAVKVADVTAIAHKVIEEAKAGQPWAIRLLLDRLLGPCLPMDVEERLKALESVLLRGDRYDVP